MEYLQYAAFIEYGAEPRTDGQEKYGLWHQFVEANEQKKKKKF